MTTRSASSLFTTSRQAAALAAASCIMSTPIMVCGAEVPGTLLPCQCRGSLADSGATTSPAALAPSGRLIGKPYDVDVGPPPRDLRAISGPPCPSYGAADEEHLLFKSPPRPYMTDARDGACTSNDRMVDRITNLRPLVSG